MIQAKNIFTLGKIFRRGDASIVITVAAVIDTTLEECIKLAMQPLSKKEYGELFGTMAPLSSFASKIRIAYALNIITKDASRQLENLRKLRNAFAHSTEAETHLNSALIAPLFDSLKQSVHLRGESSADPQTQFSECVTTIDRALTIYRNSKTTAQ